jgi:hypothetical protein
VAQLLGFGSTVGDSQSGYVVWYLDSDTTHENVVVNGSMKGRCNLELWEGAILAVGGIALVYYMANKNQAVQATLASGAGAGLSNASNLTTITNTAGGAPTVMGEPLEPPQPPLTTQSIVPTVPPNAPAKTGFGGQPARYQPLGLTPATVSNGVMAPVTHGTAVSPVDQRPIAQHVMNF